jgi:hypothetical protein
MTDFISMLDAQRMIEECYQLNEPLFLLGDPGIGKSALFNGAAKNLGIGFIDFRLTMRDPVDVGGMRVPDVKTGRMKHFVPEDLPVDEKVHGEAGLLVFDEINSVGPMMQASAYGIIQERRSGQHSLLPGWVPMASGNPVTSGASGQRISTALANRFNVQHVKPDVTSWLEQYGYEHADPRAVAFLKFRPELFHVMPTKDQVAFPSARSWTKAFKAIDKEPRFRKKLISGWVGETHAEEFEAFMRIMENAISLDEIVNDPKKARLPADHDAGLYYAVAGMLARLCDRKNFDRVMEYVNRMAADYRVMIVKTATAREPGLKNTRAYGAYAVANQEVTL